MEANLVEDVCEKHEVCKISKNIQVAQSTQYYRVTGSVHAGQEPTCVTQNTL